MLYVVNYRGRQVHSPVEVKSVDGQVVWFKDGTFADVAHGMGRGVTFVTPADDSYIIPDQDVGSGIVVVDIDATGQHVYARTADSSVHSSADGFYSESTGSPANRQGVQYGHGNTQKNFFRN